MSAIFIPTGNAGKLREFIHAFSAENRLCIGLKEASELLQDEYHWQTPIEDRETFVGNGLRKLIASFAVLENLLKHGVTSVLVDDSGLCVPRLDFSPGVHSATLAGEPRDDKRNRESLIRLLKERLDIKEHQKEPAFFVCSLLMATRVESVAVQPNFCITEIPVLLKNLEEKEPKILRLSNLRFDSANSAAFAHRSYYSTMNGLFQVDSVMGFCSGFVATTEQELLHGEGHGYDAMFFPRANPQLSFASIPLSEKNRMSHRSEALRGLSEWAKFRTAPDEIQELF